MDMNQADTAEQPATETPTETPTAPPPPPCLYVRLQQKSANGQWITKKELKGESTFWPTILLARKKLPENALSPNQRIQLVRITAWEEPVWIADLTESFLVKDYDAGQLTDQVYYDPAETRWRILMGGVQYVLNLDAKTLAKKGRFISARPGDPEGIHLEIVHMKNLDITLLIHPAQHGSGTWIIAYHQSVQTLKAQIASKQRR